MKRFAPYLAVTVLVAVIVSGFVVVAQVARPDPLAKRLKGVGAVSLSLDGNYVIPFEFSVAGDDGGSSISVSGAEGKPREFSGTPHVLGLSFSTANSVSGPVVFAGYGVVVPDDRHDSFSNVDVKDKIVSLLVFRLFIFDLFAAAQRATGCCKPAARITSSFRKRERLQLARPPIEFGRKCSTAGDNQLIIIHDQIPLRR